jgi:hypothetical protein
MIDGYCAIEIKMSDFPDRVQYYIRLADGRYIHKSARKGPDGKTSEVARLTAINAVRVKYEQLKGQGIQLELFDTDEKDADLDAD